MPAPAGPPEGLDPQELADVLNTVHQQVATALWLSAGMLCAFAAIGCIALAWRRPALCWGFLYCATLCFVHNGHAQILGPVGCGIALTGFFWPQKK